MKQQSRKTANRAKTESALDLVPILLALCITPLIILTHDYQTDFTSFDWFSTAAIDTLDSFEYNKGIWIILTGVITLAFSVWKLSASREKLKFTKLDLTVLGLAGGYAVMVIFTSLLTEYSDLAFHGGGYGMWQTMWVLLGYTLIFIYAFYFIHSKNLVFTVMKGFLITSVLMAGLGSLQAAGHNPLRWKWLQNIFTHFSQYEGINFKKGISEVILTFSNPNYVSCYVALVFPVMVSVATVRLCKNRIAGIAFQIAAGLAGAGFLFTLKGADSTAGIMALLAAAVFVVILLLSRFVVRTETEKADGKSFMSRYIIAGAAAAAILAAGVITLNVEPVKTKINHVIMGEKDTRNALNIIQTENGIKVTMRNQNIFYINAAFDQQNQIAFTAQDSDHKEIPVKWVLEKGLYMLEDERFSMFTLASASKTVENSLCQGFVITDSPNRISWTFLSKNGKWKFYTPFQKLIDLREVERFGFQNSENMANRRGYIWSRTIPLMKKYWFTGVGPNAFIIAFPNDDFVGAKRVGGSSTLVDKPHNTFLQIFIQTGGISALCYAGLCILYLVCSIRIYWGKRRYTGLERLGFGIMTGIFAFTVAGFTNDSVIGTQHAYWVLLGVGYAVNRLIKEEENGAVV